MLLKTVLLASDPEAVNKISKCLLRYKSGLRDSQKPIGSFLFLGSTGVGKTHLAKTLASKMFVTEDNFVRFDMSEFSEEQSVSKLIGSSPGYVGYDKGGILIEKVCQNPHSIILFDEIEKSHPTVQKVLLQILEEGELTDDFLDRAREKAGEEQPQVHWMFNEDEDPLVSEDKCE